MSLRHTLALLLIAAGMGSWYYYYEVKGKAGREQAKDEAKRVFKGVDPAAVQEIALKHSGGLITLKREAGGWQIMHPLRLDTDKDAMDSLLASLKGINIEETVDPDGGNLKDFGLDESLESVSFATGSNTAQTLVFGTDNPTAQYSYARIEGQKPVFLVMKYAKNNLLKNKDELRSHRVWDYSLSDVVKVSSPTLSLSQDAKGLWHIAGQKAEAGHDLVTTLLQQWHDLRIEAFSSEDGKGAFGLNSGARFQLWRKGAKQPLSLLRGKSLGKGKGYYFKVDGAPLVFTLSDASNSFLEKKAAELIPTPVPTPAPEKH